MNTTKNTASLSDYWRQHIQCWHQTDLSQIAYCRSHHLSYHRFTYWRRKLSPTDQQTQPPVRSGFVPVKACASSSIHRTPGLTATLPNGVLLQGIAVDNLGVVKQLIGLVA